MTSGRETEAHVTHRRGQTGAVHTHASVCVELPAQFTASGGESGRGPGAWSATKQQVKGKDPILLCRPWSLKP